MSFADLSDRTCAVVQDALSRRCLVCKAKPGNDCTSLIDGKPPTRQPNSPLREMNLFSGAGGLDLAVEQVFGGNTAWHCEPEKISDKKDGPLRPNPAVKVLSAHWPGGVPNIGDITTVDWSAVEPVDVLCGGFPCQDISAAGRRAGIAEGTRSGLWANYADAIAVLHPRLVVIENVRGLLHGKAHRAMESDPAAVGDGDVKPVLRALGAVLGDLSDIGYDAQWATVAASDVGSCHRRERVFIVAHPAGHGWPRINDGTSSPSARGGREWLSAGSVGSGTAADPTGDGRHEGRSESAGIIGRPDAPFGGAQPVDLLPTPSAADGGGGHLSRSGDRSDELLLPGIARAYQFGALLPTPTSRDGKGRNQRGDASCLTGALLPRPAAADAHRGPDLARANRDGSGGDDLHTFIYKADRFHQWGKYEPAIRRWESLTRQAPKAIHASTPPSLNG